MKSQSPAAAARPDGARPATRLAARLADHNVAVWGGGGFVADYDSRVLAPAEVLMLVRYREAFTGRVLDVGCGAGRVLGYLLSLGAEVTGVDISADMVQFCRTRYPGADVSVADLTHLAATVSGRFDAILLAANLIDVYDDEQRRAVLGDLRALLAPGGLLVFSSHNLTQWEAAPAASPISARARQLADRSPRWMARALTRLPRRRANRRRLAPREHRAADHAIVNDSAHDYSLLHYYIGRHDQARQLHELGYRLLETLELDGSSVTGDGDGAGPSLYYVSTPL